MLKVNDLVPEIYYEESRDFQLFGRTFEVIFNYLKTNVDLVNTNPLDRRSSQLLVKLIAKTLGFESKHEYDINDLRVICSIFSECLRKKGSLESVRLAIQGLLNAQGIKSTFRIESNSEDKILTIYLPVEIRDVVLLNDLFDYILPAGYCYKFIFGNYKKENNSVTNIASNNSIVVSKQLLNSGLGTVLALDNGEAPARTNADNVVTYDENTELSQTFTGTVSTKQNQENQGE